MGERAMRALLGIGVALWFLSGCQASPESPHANSAHDAPPLSSGGRGDPELASPHSTDDEVVGTKSNEPWVGASVDERKSFCTWVAAYLGGGGTTQTCPRGGTFRNPDATDCVSMMNPTCGATFTELGTCFRALHSVEARCRARPSECNGVVSDCFRSGHQ